LCDLSNVPPAVLVQGHLMSIQQQFRKMKELTAAQRQCVNCVTGEWVTRGRSASDALARGFGAHDARDRSPETIAALEEFNSKLVELGVMLRSQAAAARDVSAEVATDAVPARSPQRCRRSRLYARDFRQTASAEVNVGRRPRRERARLFARDCTAELDAIQVLGGSVRRPRRPRLFAGEFCPYVDLHP